MDENQKVKFKLKLIALNEKLRKKQHLEMEIDRRRNVLLREKSLTNTDRHLISMALSSQFGSIEENIKNEYKNHSRELPEILRDWI
jgi:hypothetical protein|nr:MAG TPA: hypothetical protein [Caudoviricetes sp.]